MSQFTKDGKLLGAWERGDKTPRGPAYIRLCHLQIRKSAESEILGYLFNPEQRKVSHEEACKVVNRHWKPILEEAIRQKRERGEG